jgi:hypothetical protein
MISENKAIFSFLRYSEKWTPTNPISPECPPVSVQTNWRINGINREKDNRRLKLSDSHPQTIESWNRLIDLYEAWNKPEKAKEWRAKLTQIEALME